jgi:hypothetical protein
MTLFYYEGPAFAPANDAESNSAQASSGFAQDDMLFLQAKKAIIYCT